MWVGDGGKIICDFMLCEAYLLIFCYLLHTKHTQGKTKEKHPHCASEFFHNYSFSFVLAALCV